MTDKEAIKIAFHTLVNLTSVDEYGSKEEIISKHTTMGTLRQALAQSDNQEPVAWMSTVKDDSAFDKFRFAQSDMYPTPVYTAPPKREWVGLTDEEIVACGWCDLKFARNIEAKLKEKNGG